MAMVIQRRSHELKDYFYNVCSEENLPTTWQTFKDFVVKFGTNENVSKLNKFIKESWSDYLQQVRDWAQIRRISNEEFLSKFRQASLPREVQPIFYSIGVTLDVALLRIQAIKIFAGIGEFLKMIPRCSITKKMIKIYLKLHAINVTKKGKSKC